METAESLVYRQIRRILTIMTPGETGGMEIEINLSPEGVQLIFKNKKTALFRAVFSNQTYHKIILLNRIDPSSSPYSKRQRSPSQIELFHPR